MAGLATTLYYYGRDLRPENRRDVSLPLQNILPPQPYRRRNLLVQLGIGTDGDDFTATHTDRCVPVLACQ